MNETWKKIPGFTRYEVSNLGNIRRNGSRGLFAMKQRINEQGYYQVGLIPDNNGKPKGLSVSRLVLMAFVGPCPNGFEAAHLDGKRLNNKLKNLKWVTKEENQKHKEVHGTICLGSKHGKSKLNEKAVLDIRKRYKRVSYMVSNSAALAKEYGVSKRAIEDVLVRRTWKHLLAETERGEK